MDLSFQPVISRIAKAERVLILCHDRPDGDAIGSAVGLALILEGEGKETQVVNHDPVPEALQFLPEVSRVDSQVDLVQSDLIIALDSAGRDRISSSVWDRISNDPDVINIDHHVSNPGYGDINYVDVSSPATGQIVFQLAKEAGWKINGDAASHLYAAISTDTGSFRYPSTSSETMRVVADLIDKGLDVGRLNQQLYESYPMRRVEALAFLLRDLRMDCDNRCVSVLLPFVVTERLGLRTGDTEGVIDVIRAIDSVIVAVFFEEFEDGRIRVSSRSKSDQVSVGEVCKEFGGGGHTLAAGARLSGPLNDAADRFISRVCHAIHAIDDCQSVSF
ncbi:MAG: bifunctional oligoribonuclease/PAP phosphatase NrnA [Verrucomicrobiales bacterium]|nr:bifunctional oligoribonuclease/PAP phosphatase NrnA [Verrucomicrobiales bacterium]